jgi:hypothetical protein
MNGYSVFEVYQIKGDKTTKTVYYVAVKRVCIVLFSLVSLADCGSKNQINSNLSKIMPPRILWAWERPEDLRFINPTEFGVAFLAQTVYLAGDSVVPRPRRQPLEVPPRTYMIAVTRIETSKYKGTRPLYTAEQRSKIADLIKSTLDLQDVKAVQIDFDVVASERQFYRSLVNELKAMLPPDVPLTITSLASWCVGDAWFNDFPIDEAVPMAFRMGTDDPKIRRFLKDDNDWNEPLCRGSYGVSIDEPLEAQFKPGRRIYYFKNAAWNRSDLDRLR